MPGRDSGESSVIGQKVTDEVAPEAAISVGSIPLGTPRISVSVCDSPALVSHLDDVAVVGDPVQQRWSSSCH